MAVTSVCSRLVRQAGLSQVHATGTQHPETRQCAGVPALDKTCPSTTTVQCPSSRQCTVPVLDNILFQYQTARVLDNSLSQYQTRPVLDNSLSQYQTKPCPSTRKHCPSTRQHVVPVLDNTLSHSSRQNTVPALDKKKAGKVVCNQNSCSAASTCIV